jgi:cholest-4-en-3-one 26-monooxygenase
VRRSDHATGQAQCAGEEDAVTHAIEDTAYEDVDLVDGAFWGGDPYPALAWLRRHAPVYLDRRNDVIGITRYEDIRRVSRDPDLFSSAGGIRPETGPFPYMIDMDAPEHRRRRRLVNWGFTPKRVADAEGGIRDSCDAILDRVCEAGHCDFVRDVAAPLPMIVIGDMLGVAPEDRDDLLRWSDDMLKSLGSDDEVLLTAAMNAALEYRTYLLERVAERRTSGDDSDLIGTLVHAEVDGERLDDESLVYETLLILVGGDETTRHVISGGMEALARRPAMWQALIEDRSLLPDAVEEMLRWVTPIKNMCRTATRDTELRGQAIRAGQKLMLLYPSANRDEDVFADPDEFDIRRSPNEHLAFGVGAHFCLGNRLARVEMMSMFDRLLERMPDIRLAGDGPLSLRPANFVSGIESLPVEFSPSAPVGREPGR